MKHFLLLCLLISNSIAPAFSQQYGTFKDAVNNHTYKTVKIGNYVWMEENLDATRFRNGDIIPEAKTKDDFIKAFIEKKPVWCYAFTEEKVRSKLYNYWASMDPRGLAPKGWHIPNETEVGELSGYYDRLKAAFYDSVNKAYTDTINARKERNKLIQNALDSIKLKQSNTEEIVLNNEIYVSEGEDLLEEKPLIPYNGKNAGQQLRTIGWGEGTNESGFNALPISGIMAVGRIQGGKVVNGKGQNLYVGYEVKGIFPSTLWWVKNDPKETDKRYFYLKTNSEYPSSSSDKKGIQYALPVRCVKD